MSLTTKFYSVSVSPTTSHEGHTWLGGQVVRLSCSADMEMSRTGDCQATVTDKWWCTLYNVHCTLYSVQFTVQSIHSSSPEQLSQTSKLSKIWLWGTTIQSKIWLSGTPKWSKIVLSGTPKRSKNFNLKKLQSFFFGKFSSPFF